MKMPFLSSLLNYLGGNNEEPNQSGEECPKHKTSNVLLKNEDGQEKKLCKKRVDSCHTSNENEVINGLVCGDVTDVLWNGNESQIQNSETVSNGCNDKVRDLQVDSKSEGPATLGDHIEPGECIGQSLSHSGRNIVIDTCSNSDDANSEVSYNISGMKVKCLYASTESSVEIGRGIVLDDNKTCLEVRPSKNKTTDRNGNTQDSAIDSDNLQFNGMPHNGSDVAEDCHGKVNHHMRSSEPAASIDGKEGNCFGGTLPDEKDDCYSLSTLVDSQQFKKGCMDNKDFPICYSNDNENSCNPVLASKSACSEGANEAKFLDDVNTDNDRELETMEVDNYQSLSLVDESSNITNSSLNSILTQNMVDEEERYETEDQAEAEKSRKKIMDNMRAAPEDERYNRLKNLLDRSNVYAQFLLKRMDQQREQEKTRREMKEKAKEKREAESTVKKEENQAIADENVHATRSGQQPAKGSPVESKRKRKRKVLPGEDTDDGFSKKRRKRSKKEDNLIQEKKNSDHISKEPNDEHIVRKINGEIISDRQPLLVTGGVMRSYQIDGMEWMRGLFENGINGILADEMGLGKTLQCISLLAYFVERGMKGPFLIAAPLSTLPNWVSEFKKFTPKVKTLLYHGTKDERVVMRTKILKLRMIDDDKNIKAYPVVITSYEIIMRDRAFLNYFPWKYIIIDEGHRIKNLNCRLIRELKTYKTANRLLLTGTPLQNNLAELWSLLNFLLPDIFDDLNSFQEWFDFSAVSEDGGDEKLIAQEKEEHVLETLHAILTPFLLRRLKTDVDLTIPPKRELIVFAPLTAEQQEFYKGTLDKTILNKLKQKTTPEPVVEYTSTGRPKRKVAKEIDYKSMLDDDSETFDFSQLLEKMNAEEERKKGDIAPLNTEKATSVVCVKLQNVLMQLRKCCNHPYLLERPINPETQEYIIDDSLVRVSGKMKLLDQMLPELKRRGHKVLMFSQMTKMLDIIEDFCYMRKYSFSRIDGTMKVPDRQEMIERFNNDPEVFLFLLSTRAGGLGLNLSSADTCIIYDSDWNPQVDLQAQDRCHRIGQTKPVLIFRFVTANSIDETVVDRAASKRKLEKMVIHKGRFKGKEISGKLSSQDLLELLQSKDHSHVSNIADDLVMSKENLDQMLDRGSLLLNSNVIEKTTVATDLFKVVAPSQEDALF